LPCQAAIKRASRINQARLKAIQARFRHIRHGPAVRLPLLERLMIATPTSHDTIESLLRRTPETPHNDNAAPLRCPVTGRRCEGDLSHLCEGFGCARKAGLSPHSYENS
jgi:hypothetical protein